RDNRRLRLIMNKQSIFGGKTLALAAMAVVIIAAVATGCTSPAGPAPTAASTGGVGGSFANTISVTGSGESTGTPDVANLQLGIDVTESEVGAAISRANDVMTAVQAAVKGKGVQDADMQTVNFNVYPEDIFDPTGQPTGERRYHVNNFLNVRIN